METSVFQISTQIPLSNIVLTKHKTRCTRTLVKLTSATRVAHYTGARGNTVSAKTMTVQSLWCNNVWHLLTLSLCANRIATLIKCGYLFMSHCLCVVRDCICQPQLIACNRAYPSCHLHSAIGIAVVYCNVQKHVTDVQT